MNKKILLIFSFVLFINGCSGTANIDIQKDSVTEEIVAIGKDNNEYNRIKNWNGFPLTKYYDQDLEKPFGNNREKESGVSYYDVSSDDSLKKVVAKSKFDLKEHSRSSMVRGCFKYYNIINNGNTTVFSTSNGLICSFTNFKIVVTTPYLVINNNANTVDKNTNTYVWNFTGTTDKGVYLEIDFSKKYNEISSSNNGSSSIENNNTSKKTQSLLWLIFGSMFVILLILMLILNMKRKKSLDL